MEELNNATPEDLTAMIDEMKKHQEEFNVMAEKLSKETEDVKAGLSSPEEEMDDPLIKLMDNMSKSIIEVLQDPETAKHYNILEKEGLSVQAINSLIQIITISIATTSSHSVLLYDNLMEKRLQPIFDTYYHKINKLSADNEGMVAAIETLRDRIQKSENEKMSNDVNSK